MPFHPGRFSPLGKTQLRPPWALLAGVLLLAVVLNLWQGRARARNQAMPIDEMVVAAAAPLQRAIWASGSWVDRTRESLKSSARLSVENRRLRADNARLRAEKLGLAEARARERRLQPLAAWAGPRARAVPVSVIGQMTREGTQILVLDQGRKEGLRERLPVVAPAGVVGQVYAVTDHSAQVQTVADSGAAVLVQRSRSPGIIKRHGGLLWEMQCLQPQGDVRAGDAILTSGQGGIYPRGLLVGRVVRTAPDARTGTRLAFLRPAVDFAALEEAVVYRPEAGGRD